MLLLIDSFSNQDREPTIAGARYEQWNDSNSVSTGGISYASTYGRVGGGVRLKTNCTTDGNDRWLQKMFDNYTTVIVGVACKIDTTTYSATFDASEKDQNKNIITFFDGYQAQFTVYQTPSCRIGIRLGEAGAVLGRSSRYLREDCFHYIECSAFMNATTGWIKIRVDGEEWTDLYLTNINTLSSGVAQCNGIRLGNSVNGASLESRYFFYDDFYIAAVVAGSDHNDFLGDIYTKGILPTANQGAQGWEPTAGTVHYALVNDTLQSTSTASNIRTSGAGNSDLFLCGSIDPASGTILAISPNIYARKDNAGVVRLAPLVNDGVTAKYGTEAYLTRSYQYYQQIMVKNPIDGAGWPINLSDCCAFGVTKV